jgi:ADP-ribosylglycohydrolase
LNNLDPADRLRGLMLGMMVGDAIGLPREGLSRRRAARMYSNTLSHKLLPGMGMISDDTEHACMTLAAWIHERDDPKRFGRVLAGKLRWWLVGLPAGIGNATARSVFKLWVGFSPEKSGVYSAGNGPAMRSPALGLLLVDQPKEMAAFVEASTRITHTDPKAQVGAMVIAEAAAYTSQHDEETFNTDKCFQRIECWITDDDNDALRWLEIVKNALDEGWDDDHFLAELRCPNGPSGYMYHTVPAVLWAWLKSPFDFHAAITRVVCLGGDADTTGAICGALAGAAVGEAGIPAEWVRGVRDFPRSPVYIRRLTQAAADNTFPPRLFWPFIPVRNLLFLIIVLLHGFRRLLPPY